MSFAFISRENKAFIKRLTVLAFPIIIQELINNGSLVVISMIVGLLGLHAITAVGIANQVYFLFYMFCFGINTSAAVLMAQFWGKGDVKNIYKTMGLAFIGGFICATLFTVVATVFPEQVMLFFSDKDPQVVALGIQYLQMVFLSYFLIAVNETLKYSLRSIGQTKIPVFSTVVNLLACTALTFLFTQWFHLGVQGAALAIILARLAEMVTQVFLIFKLRLPLATTIKNYFSATKGFTQEFLKMSTPIIMNEVMWGLGTVLYIYAYKFTGLHGLGAVEISQSIVNLFMVLGRALGSGSGIIIANTLGAGEIDLAKTYSRKAMFFVGVVSIGMALMLVLLSPAIINVYDVPEIVKTYTYRILLVVAASMLLRALNYTMVVGILRSGGDTVFCLLVDTGSVWLVALPLAYVCARFLGFPVYFVTLAICSEEVVKFILCFARTLRNQWAKNLVADL